jgi:hypothetical protein
LKNFCFNDGVKVLKAVISSDDEFDMSILEKNFFSKPKSTFCLVQQISPEDIQKYFIIGIKFDDFYITPVKIWSNDMNKRKNYINVFTYEKTYLFICQQPLCKLFDTILQAMLNIKKLNLLQNMSNFGFCFMPEHKGTFETENNEKISLQLNELLNSFYYRPFPFFEEKLYYKSERNNIVVNYTYPNTFNEAFIATDWLCKQFFNIIDYNTLFMILTRILLEHSFIFISDDIQLLTSTVLGFSYLIQPFNWPFIIVPNLPLDLMSMIDSPVPFLIGMLGDNELIKRLQSMNTLCSNIVRITKDKFEFYVKLPLFSHVTRSSISNPI